MVDRDLVRRKVAQVDEYLAQLSEYREVGLGAYRADWKTQRIVERTLHLTIEACMDIADHLVADRRLRIPETGAASFDILVEGGVVPAELGERLARMVGFRNILVHDYARIDPEIVLGALRDDLADVRKFRDLVLSAI